ncbi:hypothetical protein FACS189497_15310 [Betaproteobacteria bacterium]|nr:hypothetical protein FACS189497_15310 [Betaproteobacteria bacterium]
MTTWIDALPTAHTAAAAAAPTANSAALTHGAVAVPLLHLGLLHAEGEDAKTFLHNLLSNDVAKLPADGAQWTSFNTPKGRMLASFLLWPDDTGYSLALAADITPALLEKLQRYILRSKVKLFCRPNAAIASITRCGWRRCGLWSQPDSGCSTVCGA